MTYSVVDRILAYDYDFCVVYIYLETPTIRDQGEKGNG